MAPKKYPKKSFGSYILPFLLIFALIASAFYVIKNRVNITDIQEFFSPPQVAKDEKVEVVFQNGNNTVLPWRQNTWDDLSPDMVLQVGDTLKTGEDGTVVMRFFDKSEIRLAGGTKIKLVRMDEDDVDGNHLAIEIEEGHVWGRIQDGNTPDADFIIDSLHQVIQLSDATLLDINLDPEVTRVLGGSATINIGSKINGSRKPLGQVTLEAGEQLALATSVFDQLELNEEELVGGIESSFFESEWYLWNNEKEEKLGLIVESVVEGKDIQKDLVDLDDGLVTIVGPEEGESVTSKLAVSGSYDNETIEKIMVNNQEATLGISDQWEQIITLSESKRTITVSAFKKDDTQEYLVKSYSVEVDIRGPVLGKIIKPVVDENGNGELTTDAIELMGEISTDALRVCVSHNDGSPYCLKQFAAGDGEYKYLGAVKYGNVVEGKNKYVIQAYDAFDNVTEKTVYFFKGIAKPIEKIDNTPSPTDETTSVEEETEAVEKVELSKPVISDPSPDKVFETSKSILHITGTVSSDTEALYVDGKKADYTAGSTSFAIKLTLDTGESIIKIQAGDSQGEKSKTAILKVLYIEDSE
ncbi:MAG: hypothetical protein P1V18_00575 [Candidatus Gracilibacteria bacterium]|nr:hypothetical protein [Candidatus Gracilibacteria bacterium]